MIENSKSLGVTARGYSSRRSVASALLGALATLQTIDAYAAYRLQKAPEPPTISTLIGPHLTSTVDWWSHGVVAGKSFHLDPEGGFADSLRQFKVTTQWQMGSSGAPLVPSFVAKIRWVSDLYWHVNVNETPQFDELSPAYNGWVPDALADRTDPFVPSLEPFESLAASAAVGLGPLLQAPKPISIPIVTRRSCPAWKAPRPVAFTGLGGEGTKITLLDCDGVVSADAIDQLSALARLPGTPVPTLPLPLSPDANLPVRGEWVEGVRLLHPRLLGVIEQLASAFPGRSVAVYSGYRRDARQTSPHLRGRAIDMAIKDVSNDQLFAYCRTLRDTGCGYYPNQPFVHVNVREPSQGSAAWIDVAEPGRPSIYTELWPKPHGDSKAPEVD